MIEVWIAAALLNARLAALAARSAGEAWAWLALGPVAGQGAAAAPPRHPDLLALDLDRMPRSPDELRRAYRRAAKAAHPDAGGSAEAFRAVSEAFARLSGARRGARAA